MFDAADGKLLLRAERNVTAGAFSPDGNRLVGTVGTTVVIWDTSKGRQLAVLRGHEKLIYFVSFTPRWKARVDCINGRNPAGLEF